MQNLSTQAQYCMHPIGLAKHTGLPLPGEVCAECHCREPPHGAMQNPTRLQFPHCLSSRACCVRTDHLITGQNHTSARQVTDMVIEDTSFGVRLTP